MIVKQVKTIDCLRGFAAAAVCVYHFTCGNSAYLSDNNVFKAIGQFGYLGVEIFFIISGFILPFSMFQNNYSLKNFWNFIKKRLLRLEPPYILVIILAIALNYLSTFSPYYRGGPYKIDFTQLFLHFGYLTTIFHKEWINPAFWTLAIEFQFYLLLALLYPLLLKNKLGLYLFVAASLLLSFTCDSEKYIFKYLPFFCLGISLFYYFKAKLKIWEFIILMVLIYAFILYRFNYQFLLASLVPLILCATSQLDNKPLLFLGKISYSLYLLHIPIGMRIINLAQGRTNNILIREIVIVADLAFLVIVSYLFFRLVELPSIKLSKKFKYD